MAERRMFAKTIIDSDAFLDMPLSTQALYFHLAMRADDEGFVNNPKKIQRVVGASDDDIKVLVSKNFIIPFESGVVVIKHWRIHNYIRADRKKDTAYPEEMKMLSIKENGAYTFNKIIPIEEDASRDGETARQKAYRESTLPYSFDYKIRRAFTGKTCPICGASMIPTVDECGIVIDVNSPTIQHNKPISKGGKHELGNISVICHRCNVTLQDTETGSLNADEVADVWERLSSDSQMTVKCQSDDGIGKDSIGKDSIDKINNKLLSNDNNSSVKNDEHGSFQWLIDAWNALSLYGIKPISRITSGSNRENWARARLRQYGKEAMLEAIENIKHSDFLQGKHSGKPWMITFDWFLRPNNFPKVLEGNYGMKPKEGTPVPESPKEEEFDLEKWEEENGYGFV